MGEYDNRTEELVDSLPTHFPKSESSNNYKLLDVIGDEVEKSESDIETVEKASSIRTAETIKQIEALASLVDLKPKFDEPLETYRFRTIAEYQTVRGQGTVSDLLNSIASILDVNPETISYDEGGEDLINLSIPGTEINDIDFESNKIAKIVERLSPAGYGISAFSRGTLLYISPEEYELGTYNTNAGYDTLENGEPTGNGGTYSGVIS